MKCTDFWKIETELRKQAVAELKKAIEAHGGEYTFYLTDDETEELSDEELEENENNRDEAPIVLCNHSHYGPIDVRISSLSTRDGLTILGQEVENIRDYVNVDTDDLSAIGIQAIIEYMKEPDAVD